MDLPEHHAPTLLAEGGSLHEPELLQRGWTKASLAAARRSYTIVAWKDHLGGWHYPRWQFDENFRVLPHAEELVKLLRSRDPLYVIATFVSRGGKGEKSRLQLIREGKGDVAVQELRATLEEEKEFDEFSPAQLKELKRRVAEVRDETRYVVVTSIFRGAAGVYDVTRNAYCHRSISEGCLIKSREVAEALAKQLRGTLKARNDLHVITVCPSKGGYVTKETIPGGAGEKPWRPAFDILDDTPVFVPLAPTDARPGVLDAMLFALRHRAWLMEKLSECRDRRTATKLLVGGCRLAPGQAAAVLDMRFWSVTKSEQRALERELRAAL
ncbi:hypothetical protein DB347_17780 [Opitutaceae bacterium EW11]|nr:hypothetical protein DB347_17780 [Opitutaceae bacterium EW11]